MNFLKEDLKNFAQALLVIAEREGISSLSDLEEKVDMTFPVEDSDDRVLIKLRTTMYGKTTYIMSYMVPNRGIPLELQINKRFGHSQVIVKAAFMFIGYNPFSQDMYGNIIQAKVIFSTDLSQLKKELESLAA